MCWTHRLREWFLHQITVSLQNRLRRILVPLLPGWRVCGQKTQPKPWPRSEPLRPSRSWNTSNVATSEKSNVLIRGSKEIERRARIGYGLREILKERQSYEESETKKLFTNWQKT